MPANPLLEEVELLLMGQRCLVNCHQHLLQRSLESRPGIIIAGVNPHWHRDDKYTISLSLSNDVGSDSASTDSRFSIVTSF